MKYMNSGIVLLSFLLLSQIASADRVPEDQARKVAVNFFYEHIQPFRQVKMEELKIETVEIIREGNDLLYYMMNFSGGGFIAVAASDAVYPVLCYSFQGRHSREGQPENFKAWMEQYRKQIQYAIDSKASPDQKTAEAWTYYLETPVESLKSFSGRDVPPMLNSDWDQNKYYNEMCPADGAGPGGHCYAGCVATALGQVMNYFRWPQTGLGSYTYYCPPYDSLSADFGSSTYQWDLMEPSLGHSNLELAELLYHLGVSVDMVYGPDGSGMYNHKAAYTLRTYFKYSQETQYVFRDSTSMDWDSLLISHLDQRIPMYYAGWSVPNLYGHAFVCDGYQGTDYYHFNWGWSSAYNGYFYTDNLTPGGSNFNLAQEVIIHAVPDTGLYTYPVNCQGDITYHDMFGTLEDGSGPLYAYSNGSDCSWLISPDDSVNSISLDILRFNLAEGDTLKVYDGDSTNAPLLAAFSADTVPATVTTTGKIMLVTFQSDDSITEEGFLASFESEIPVYCSGSTLLTGQADTLTDGSGSYDYHNNSTCTWIINPPGASTVTLTFTGFETEEGFDFLKIYDLQTSQLIVELTGSYPGGIPDPVTSPSGKMFIAFSTNYSGTAEGWSAYYETDLVGISENGLPGEISVFPNPASESIYIRFGPGTNRPGVITLSDLSGKVLVRNETGEFDSNPVKMDVSGIAPGLYFLVFGEEKEMTGCRKIVIR